MWEGWKDSALYGQLPRRIAVGWSGGIDSTALLLMLQQAGFQVEAWHVDHAWHGQSQAQSHQLKKQAEAWGIAFFLRRLSEAPQSNREAAARQGRYGAFQDLAEERGLYAIALGHHADDQVETVCMRMLQGSGVMGMRGIHAQSKMRGLTLYRPLLHVRRAVLKEWLLSMGVPWLDDRSNTDLSLWRNRIRLKLLPEMDVHGVDSAALWLRWHQQAWRVSCEIEHGMGDVSLEQRDGCCSVSWQMWAQLPQPMRVQLLQRMTSKLFGAGVVLGKRHLLLIECWREKGGKSGVDLSGCRLYRQGEGLHLEVRAASSRP